MRERTKKQKQVVRWRRNGFTVRRNLLTKELFVQWIENDGKMALAKQFRHLRLKWFFGRTRARSLLYRRVRAVLSPKRGFALSLTQSLNELPTVLGRFGAFVAKRKYRDLCSTDGDNTLTVMPRAVVQHEFTVFVLEKMSSMPALKEYDGLAVRVISQACTEAEFLFFDSIGKGKHYQHPNGAGFVLDVDPTYRWQINGVDGHYFYAFSTGDNHGLATKRNARRFISEMREVLYGQKVYLRTLHRNQIMDIADAFQIQQSSV